jgi:uncharacterized membrane protein YagU involved in acid resistance
MEIFFTPLAIFVATCASFLFGLVWYSPFLFMNAWLRGEGVKKGDVPSRSFMYTTQINLYSFIAHAALSSVLAIIFDLLAVTSSKIAISLGLLLTFGLIVTTRFMDMIYTVHGNHYQARSQIKFLVSSGYYLVVTTIISLTLFLMRGY